MPDTPVTVISPKGLLRERSCVVDRESISPINQVSEHRKTENSLIREHEVTNANNSGNR